MKRILLLVFTLISIFSCTQPENIVDPIEPELEDFKVSSQYFDGFLNEYKYFIESMSEENRSQLEVFLSELEAEKEKMNGRVNDVTCNCQQGESSCSAATAISSCCVCWNASTHEGACGTYFGIAHCKTGPKEDASIARESLNAEDHTVQVNAKNFRSILSFAKSKEINISKISKALTELQSHAIIE